MVIVANVELMQIHNPETGWLACWLASGLAGWPAGWLPAGCQLAAELVTELVARLAARPGGWRARWPAAWLATWLAADGLTRSPYGCLATPLLRWLTFVLWCRRLRRIST